MVWQSTWKYSWKISTEKEKKKKEKRAKCFQGIWSRQSAPIHRLSHHPLEQSPKKFDAHAYFCSRNYFDAVFGVIYRLKLKVDAGGDATWRHHYKWIVRRNNNEHFDFVMRAIKYEAMSSEKPLMSCIASNTPLQFLFTSITGIANTTNYRHWITESEYSANIRINFVSLYRKFISNRKKTVGKKCAQTSIMYKRTMRIFCCCSLKMLFSDSKHFFVCLFHSQSYPKRKKTRGEDVPMEMNISMKPTQVADPSRTHFHSIDSIMIFVFLLFVGSFNRSFLRKSGCDNFDDAVFNEVVGERTWMKF